MFNFWLWKNCFYSIANCVSRYFDHRTSEKVWSKSVEWAHQDSSKLLLNSSLFCSDHSFDLDHFHCYIYSSFLYLNYNFLKRILYILFYIFIRLIKNFCNFNRIMRQYHAWIYRFCLLPLIFLRIFVIFVVHLLFKFSNLDFYRFFTCFIAKFLLFLHFFYLKKSKV